MPRVFPLPKPKVKTRWEMFAELKGIKKHKRSRKVYDPSVDDWVPRWGYKSIKKNKVNRPPIIEVKDGEEGDLFEKRSTKQSIMKARQKMRELRNKMEAQNPDDRKSQLFRNLQRVKESTKGCGKFGKGAKNKVKIAIKRKPKTESLESEKKSYLSSIKKLQL
ncbi:ribosome biogenesis regulatory protein, putative [Theileria equi strain WA]|uniref:Ribosome biogenesis regulatory protein n=1 Tax=Theileria equi strain WA TaxID=1537102 RepID=L1LFQ2_THEEQ|nr:ribosome biogenesis regulatory protein, putative [Theileria equi strain WA]EKX74090.1 ribosome biogenesis regulatory protein, putative [Theileria equi strain WA]|eukprot:XP_004833542.1 ribosome biogenesis regulatory protein, putative [Theileria equi strain WA]